MSHSEMVTKIGWHSQPAPGYAENEGIRTSEICWDAPICVSVYLNDEPQLGMAVELHNSVLSIRQLQGAPGAEIPKELHKWPALFVQAAKLFLVNSKKISLLRLHAADTRVSYKYPAKSFTVEEMKLYQQNLRRHYDDTARQQGLKKHPRGRYFEWTHLGNNDSETFALQC